jgi:17-hydroxy-3-oxo-4-pregnene-20-carboxyl-CoA lyase
VTPVVAGVGRSRFSRRSGATEMSLAAQAIAAALRDAKVAPRDVDGVVRFDRDALWEYDLPGVFGIANLGFYNAVPSGPGGAPALLRMAAMAITEGLASVVLCHHTRDGVARPTPPPAAEAAWLARLQRVSEADVARTTLAHRRAALRNPSALVRRPLTAADRKKSPYVAEPIRRVDLAAPAVGACAFVVTAAERARRPAPRILGSMQVALPSLARHPSDWLAASPLEQIARAAKAMFAGARVRPGDVGVACVNADASPLVPIAVKLYRVATARVNPHGGQLCEAALDGVNDVAEAVRQMRGDAATPARGARVALVTGSLLEPTSAVLLGRPS